MTTPTDAHRWRLPFLRRPPVPPSRMVVTPRRVSVPVEPPLNYGAVGDIELHKDHDNNH